MLIDSKEKFLIKSVSEGNLKATHELYKIYSDSKDRFQDAAYLYQEILIKYCPKDAVKILYLNGNVNRLSQKEIEREYLLAFEAVAWYMIINGLYFNAVNWAKKGMDLFELFYSQYPEKVKTAIQEKSKEYQLLKKQFDEFKNYFNPTYYYGNWKYTGLKFEWEQTYISSIHHDNDN